MRARGSWAHCSSWTPSPNAWELRGRRGTCGRDPELSLSLACGLTGGSRPEPHRAPGGALRTRPRAERSALGFRLVRPALGAGPGVLLCSVCWIPEWVLETTHQVAPVPRLSFVRGAGANPRRKQAGAGAGRGRGLRSPGSRRTVPGPCPPGVQACRPWAGAVRSPAAPGGGGGDGSRETQAAAAQAGCPPALQRRRVCCFWVHPPGWTSGLVSFGASPSWCSAQYSMRASVRPVPLRCDPSTYSVIIP